MCAHCQHVKSLVMHSTKIEVKECHIFIFCKDKLYSPFFFRSYNADSFICKGQETNYNKNNTEENTDKSVPTKT